MNNFICSCIKKQVTIFSFIISTVCVAGEPLPFSVQGLWEKFSQTDAEQQFEQEIPSLKTASEQEAALLTLAAYQEYKGNYEAACLQYQKAAQLHKGLENKYLLRAVQTFITAGQTQSARIVLEKLSCYHSGDDYDAAYRLSVLCESLLLIAEEHIEQGIALLRQCIVKPAFSELHPVMLLVLWWIDADLSAYNALLHHFPNSMEAAAAKGRILLQPSRFWYLLSKTDSALNYAQGSIPQPVQAQAVKSVQIPDSAGPMRRIPLCYQIGFFQNRQNAEVLAEKLRKKGFSVMLKDEKRTSGTVYTAVLVEENAAGTIGRLLEETGFEAAPVFEK